MGTHDHHAHHMMEEMNTTGSDMTSIPTTIASVLHAAMTTMVAHDMHHHHSAPGSVPSGHSMVLDESGAIPSVSTDISDHSGHGLHASAHGTSGNDHMMMYFHFSTNATILFKQWQISTMQGLIGSVICIFLLAMFYEALKFFREYLFKKFFTSLEYSSVSVLDNDGKSVTEVHKVARNRMMSWPHLTQTGLHMLQLTLSYSLMLICMTYNIWLCLGVILGTGLGYFLFGWKKATVVDITEHCH